MKKIVKLTENDLMRIVKKVIKENEDMRYNSTFEDFMSDIEEIYEYISSAESAEELDGLETELQNLYSEIESSEDLNDDEMDELINGIGECSDFIGDMYSELEDKKTMRGRFFDKEDQEDDM